MANPLVAFSINRIIVHEIYHRQDDKRINPPKYSDELLKLDTTGLGVLQDRIIMAVGNDAQCLDMTISKADDGSTFSLCKQLINSTDDIFIDLSKQITSKLTEAQTSRNIPGGTIVVFEGIYGTPEKKVVGIIKAEDDSGFSKTSGNHKIVLNYLNNILLTKNKKLYKIGIFKQYQELQTSESLKLEHFSAIVYDHNLTLSDKAEAAHYFYSAFLGCEKSSTAKMLTKSFFDLTSEFLNDADLKSQKKIDLYSALYVYLRESQLSVIDIKTFADQFLPQRLRDSYKNFMIEKDFPEHAVSKDTTLLANVLKRHTLIFSSKVKISAPSEGFSDAVKIIETEDGYTQLRIRGEIEKQK